MPRRRRRRRTDPEGSTDPLLDGMTSIVRELGEKGFAVGTANALGNRVRAILEIAAVA